MAAADRSPPSSFRPRRPGASGWRPLAAHLARVGLIGAALGAAFQLARADRWWPTAPFAFSLAPAVVAALLAGAAVCWLAAGRRRAAALTLALALAAGGLALALDFRFGACPPAAASGGAVTRVATWNVQHRWSAAMGSRLRAVDPDVAALIEAEPVDVRRWAAALPDHHLCAPGFGIVVLSRAPLLSCEKRRLTRPSRSVVAVVGGEPGLRLLAVDLDGHPLRSRRRPIRRLAELAAEGSEDTVLAGDFNTPRRAWGFDPLRSTHASAFASAGRGWAPTWPAPLAVLDLDQVWLPSKRRALCARSLPGTGSDHRLVVVDFR